MYALGIPQIFPFTLLLRLCWANSPPLNARPVPLLRQVFFYVFSDVFFSLVFRSPFEVSFVAFELHLGALWEPFGGLFDTF